MREYFFGYLIVSTLYAGLILGIALFVPRGTDEWCDEGKGLINQTPLTVTLVTVFYSLAWPYHVVRVALIPFKRDQS